MIKNYSCKNDYYTQVNNKSYPLTSCKNTSVIMALNQAGWTEEVKQMEIETLFDGLQPEDLLTELAYFRGYREFAKKKTPWFFEGDKPQVPMHEIPQVTVKQVHDLVGKVASLVENYSLSYIVNKLDNGFGIAALGELVTPDHKKYNHVVSIAGYEIDNGYVSHIIIDDPFGDFHTGYRDRNGNNVRMTNKQFKEFFLTNLYKWIILINPRGDYV